MESLDQQCGQNPQKEDVSLGKPVKDEEILADSLTAGTSSIDDSDEAYEYEDENPLETIDGIRPKSESALVVKQDETGIEEVAPRKPIGKAVSFGCLEIREYPMALGDHPGSGCCVGPPVTIGWEYSASQRMSVEEYEMTAGEAPRRTGEELQLSALARKRMLTGLGHSADELRRVEGECRTVLSQRRTSFALVPVSHIEEAYQSAQRKGRRLKRWLLPNKK